MLFWLFAAARKMGHFGLPYSLLNSKYILSQTHEKSIFSTIIWNCPWFIQSLQNHHFLFTQSTDNLNTLVHMWHRLMSHSHFMWLQSWSNLRITSMTDNSQRLHSPNLQAIIDLWTSYPLVSLDNYIYKHSIIIKLYICEYSLLFLKICSRYSKEPYHHRDGSFEYP